MCLRAPQSVESVEAQIADAVEPPPAYTGSVRSSRRASYAARSNVTTGTILGEADLGTGVDTIRPVKKVDTIRSLRLSEEYVGSIRSREGSTSSNPPSSPSSTKGSHKRGATEAQAAGKSLVDEVMLPLLQKVCLIGSFCLLQTTDKTCFRRQETIWTRERSSR